LSTLADLVGACAFALRPLAELIEAHVLAAERLHGDDTPLRVLAKGQCAKATIWAYVRDDRPFGGPDPPAVMVRYSRDRKGTNPTGHLDGFAGVLQADAYSGFNRLFDPARQGTSITLAWAHSRRTFFELADVAKQARSKKQVIISPMALEAVKRIDMLFDIERAINGKSIEERLEARREHSAPLMAELEAWMREERAKLSRHAPVAKAFDYMLKRWDSFARFLEDGRICLTSNAAERALRGVALGRKSWLFAGSDPGGGDLHPDRHRQAQRCRSPGLAGRCPRQDRRSYGTSARASAALALEGRASFKSRISPWRSANAYEAGDRTSSAGGMPRQSLSPTPSEGANRVKDSASDWRVIIAG
jgi:hypothetical protein